MLTITDTIDSFELTKKESITLEIKLNVSDHGHRWSHIGDALYNYGSKGIYNANEDEAQVLTVTADQYMFLRMLYIV